MGLHSIWMLALAVLLGLAAPARAQVCEHGLCEEGSGLNPSCDPCVADICRADDFCCTYEWDNVCIEEVATICGLTLCTAACAHSPCDVGDPLDASCNRCAGKVCEADPVCCSSQWDATCVALVETECSLTRCEQGADNCQNALDVENGTDFVQLLGTLEGASPDGCSGADTGCSSEDVWYSYKVSPSTAEPRFVNTCGTEYSFGIDTVISVHSACPGNQNTELYSNDDWKFGPDPLACVGSYPRRYLDSSVPIPFEPGRTFKIRVSRFRDSPTGNYQVYIPEPSSAMLAGAGLATVFALSRWRLRRRRGLASH